VECNGLLRNRRWFAIAVLLRGQTQAWQENAAMLVEMCLYTVLNYFGKRFSAFWT